MSPERFHAKPALLAQHKIGEDALVERVPIRSVRYGGLPIAHQVVDEDDVDLVSVPGWKWNLVYIRHD